MSFHRATDEDSRLRIRAPDECSSLPESISEQAREASPQGRVARRDLGDVPLCDPGGDRGLLRAHGGATLGLGIDSSHLADVLAGRPRSDPLILHQHVHAPDEQECDFVAAVVLSVGGGVPSVYAGSPVLANAHYGYAADEAEHNAG